MDEAQPDAPTPGETAETAADPQYKPRPKFGGRKKGSVNKKTLERIALAEREISAARGGKKLAIDHMDDLIEYFRGLVAIHQPWNLDGTMKPGKNEKLWFRCVDAFKGFLALRAPYQSPTLGAVQIIPAQARQRTTVNVTILNERGDRIFSDDDNEDGSPGVKVIEHVADDAAA